MPETNFRAWAPMSQLGHLTANENYSQYVDLGGVSISKEQIMEADWNARGDTAETERMRDWLESQSSVLGFWMERLVDQGNLDLMARLETHRRNLQGLIVDLR